jgi:hypothetical protein
MDEAGTRIRMENKYRTVFNSTAQEEIILVRHPAATSIVNQNGVLHPNFFKTP